MGQTTDLMTLPAASRESGIHVETLRSAVRAGRLAAVAIKSANPSGHIWAISSQALDEWVARRARRITLERARAIRAAYQTPGGPNQRQLAALYQVTQPTISYIVNGRRWREPADAARSAG